MVQIKIMRSEQLKEHFIIEMQGQVISRHNNGMAGNHFGDLHFNKQGEPLLIIGHHIIPGKVEELEKPFACMRKVTGEGGVRYEVKAVIRKRVLFDTRPKPIILLNKKSIYNVNKVNSLQMMVYTYTGALLIVHGFLVYKFYKCRAELDPSTPWNQMNLMELFPDDNTDTDQLDEEIHQFKDEINQLNAPNWWDHYFNWSKPDKPPCDVTMLQLRQAIKKL